MEPVKSGHQRRVRDVLKGRLQVSDGRRLGTVPERVEDAAFEGAQTNRRMICHKWEILPNAFLKFTRNRPFFE